MKLEGTLRRYSLDHRHGSSHLQADNIGYWSYSIFTPTSITYAQIWNVTVTFIVPIMFVLQLFR